MGFDNTYQPGLITLHEKILSVNIYNNTGILREMDRERFRSLEKKRKELQEQYRKKRKSIIKAYRDKGDYLKSEEFWRKYLGV